MSGTGSDGPSVGGRKYDRLAREYDERWSSYVQASIAETLKRLMVRDGDAVLDVGCGTGQLIRALSERHALRLYGVDPSEQMLAVARARVPAAMLQQTSADHLPFESGSMDCVVSTSVFHYLRTPAAALAEWRRVLRPDGSVVVTDWCGDFLAMKASALVYRIGSPAYAKTYTAREMKALLRAAGFHGVFVDRYHINWFWGLMTARGRATA